MIPAIQILAAKMLFAVNAVVQHVAAALNPTLVIPILPVAVPNVFTIQNAPHHWLALNNIVAIHAAVLVVPTLNVL